MAAGLAIAGATGAACGAEKTQCECADPTVRVEIPAERAPDAVSVTLSGRGCATAVAQCTQPVGSGCAEYVFQGTGVGTCDVDVRFQSNPADFNEELSFSGTTCCPGFYVEPPGASPVVVPGAQPDAGGAG